MSESDMQAELDRLRAENARLKNKENGGAYTTIKMPAPGQLTTVAI